MKINPRPKYLDTIRPFIGTKLIKALVGQRRSGKSYLLRYIANEITAKDPDYQIIFIDKEKYEFDAIRNYQDLMAYIQEHKKSTKLGLFIDEIQEIVEFEKAIRSLYSEPSIDIYISGSNANLLAGELGTLLSGRYIELEVTPLNYPEFLEFYQFTDSEANFSKFIQFGGLPGLVELPNDERVQSDYLQNVYHSILFRDVIRRNQIRNVAFLENLIHYLADNVGSLVSAKKISDFLKSQRISISVNSVLDYLTFLCNAFIIRKVPRQEVGGKKIFEIGEKYYFEDLGIRHALVGYRLTDIHKVLENLVFNHLKSVGYQVRIGTLGNREIDFIGEKNGELCYIQVAYLLQDSQTIEREFGNLLAIQDQYPKYVVSMDALTSPNTFQGIRHLSIRNFLTNFC